MAAQLPQGAQTSYRSFGKTEFIADAGCRKVVCMERESLTPGKLYARMSAEFRRRSGHTNCRMPMVMLAHRVTPEGPNWTLETGSQSACSKCMPMALAIAGDAAEHYDLRDPTAMPRWPANAVRPPPQQSGAAR